MTAVLDDAQISLLEECIQDYEQLYGVPTYASEETLNMGCSSGCQGGCQGGCGGGCEGTCKDSCDSGCKGPAQFT